MKAQINVFLFIQSILIITLSFSCSGRNVPDSFPNAKTFDKEQVKHIHLSGGKKLELSPPMRIARFVTSDSILIASGQSTENDFGLHIYCLKSGQHITSFAPFGRGPDENLYISRFQILPERKGLFYFDLQARRARLYDLDSILTGQTIKPIETISFNESSFDALLRFDKDVYLCKNSLIKPAHDNFVMFSRISVPDYSILKTNYFPRLESIPSDIWYSQLMDIFSMEYSYNTIAGYLVISYYWTDLLEVYDNDLNRLARIHGPDQFLPVHDFAPAQGISGGRIDRSNARSGGPKSPMDNVVRPEGVAMVGYELCFAANSGFYASYHGVPRTSGRNRVFPQNIYHFHYHGTPLYRYTFDIGEFGLLLSMQKRQEYILLTSSERYGSII